MIFCFAIKIGLAINYVLGSNSIEAYGFSASFTIASTTLTQFIVFLPKVTNTRTLAVNLLIPAAYQIKMNI